MCLGLSLFYWSDFIEYPRCLTLERCQCPRHSFCPHIACWGSGRMGTGTDVSNKGYQMPWQRCLGFCVSKWEAHLAAWVGWGKASWRRWPFWIPLSIVYSSFGFGGLWLSCFKFSKVWVSLEVLSWAWPPLLPMESSSPWGEAYTWKNFTTFSLQLLLDSLWRRAELHLISFS